MRGRICKRFTFDAAHMLPDHDGKCANLHGHTYVVEVEFEGPIIEEGPKRGMVVDFGDVKAVWKEKLEPLLDHRYLNETLVELPVTTAEMIAGWVYGRFTDANLEPAAVRVWETPTSWAQYP
jgi:6-pyruvoyltetrahydropterin/6-carboxytetrahydropterin synthase